jgi:histidinol-phosphate/aromatic aminotransferase/cobyric acid decarboxylase-like protein
VRPCLSRGGFDNQGGEGIAALGHQYVIGAAGGGGIHDLDANASFVQGAQQYRRREALALAGAQQNDITLAGHKLANVCYDIRGPVLQKAKQMEDEGHKIIKLNIGNLAPFGFDSPEEIQLDMIRNLPNAAGYSDSKGIFSARKAIMHYTQQKHIKGVTLEDIYVGNGVSELIVMAMNALLNTGDEVLVPAPDYPLWTAAVSLSGGSPRHYICDESNGWLPDLDDIRAKITPRTRAIVIINPNNPTGALYPDDTAARRSSRSPASTA